MNEAKPEGNPMTIPSSPSQGGDPAQWLQWLLHTGSDLTPGPELRSAIQTVLDRAGVATSLARRALTVAYAIHDKPATTLDARILADIKVKLAKCVALDALVCPPLSPAGCKPGCDCTGYVDPNKVCNACNHSVEEHQV